MRKRSRYKPKGIMSDPLRWVLNGFKPMRSESSAVSLKIKNHQAMLDATQGKATRQQLDVLIASMNMAEALHRVNPALGYEYAQDIKAAQDALLAMCKRGLERGSFLFTGPELQAMNQGMEIHDAQLDACTLGELDKGLQLVAKEIRARKARVIA